MPQPILIWEPVAEVRELFIHVVTRLGHEPIVYNGQSATELKDVAAVLLEPADLAGVELVESLRRERPNLPVVCASIYPASREALERLRPVAYLEKPLGRAELDRALAQALSSSASPVEEAGGIEQ